MRRSQRSVVLDEIQANLPLLLGVIAFLLLIWIYAPLTAAIAYGLLLAYLSRPLMRRFESYTGEGLAAFLSIIIISTIVVSILAYTAYQAGIEFASLNPNQIVNSLVGASKTISKFASEHPEFMPVIHSFSSQLDKYTDFITTQAVNLIFYLVNLVITLVMALVIAFFLLYDGNKIRKFLEMISPAEVKAQISRIDRNLYGIYVGSLLSALIVGFITTVTFLVFGIPYPFLAGAVAAILQFIPMVGPQLFLIPGTIVAAMFGRYLQAVVLLALAVFLFFVPDNAIKPVIMKRTTNIHPLLVLLSFIGGVVVFGAPGFVIGPFVLAVADGLIHAWLNWE